MLAKYNLKVGKIYDSGGTQTGTYSSGDTGYGLQSSEEKGYAEGQVRYGTVAFSATNYWYDGSNLKAKYGSAWNTNNVYEAEILRITSRKINLSTGKVMFTFKYEKKVLIYVNEKGGIIRYIFTDDPVPTYDNLKDCLENVIR